MDLQPIIKVWQATVDQYDRNIRQCGSKWTPQYIATLRIQQQAVRDCIAELQTPGITPEQALAAIVRECETLLANPS
jgi:hypothetical protein